MITSKLREMPWQSTYRFYAGTGGSQSCVRLASGRWDKGEGREKWKPMLEKQLRALLVDFKLGAGGESEGGQEAGKRVISRSSQKTWLLATIVHTGDGGHHEATAGQGTRGHRRDGGKVRGGRGGSPNSGSDSAPCTQCYPMSQGAQGQVGGKKGIGKVLTI